MKILKKIGFICCAVLIGLGAIFLPRTANLHSYIAKADDVYQYYDYVSNDTYYMTVPVVNYVNSNSVNALFSVSLLGRSTGVIYQPRVYLATGTGSTGSITYNRMDYIGVRSQGSAWNAYTMYNADDGYTLNTNTAYQLCFTDSSTYGASLYITGNTYTQADFNCNVYKVRLYLSHETEWESRNDYNFLRIQFFDSNDKYCVYSFLVSNDFYFNDRTYYLVNLENLTDTQMYNQGYQDGLLAEQNNIYQQGREDGFSGGYNQGYVEGIEAASNNNFFTLIGAAVDVPITALTSLLNFTFLGVNLLAFVTSILTLALIIFVIKKFMGKG